ncbi:fimbria/pilus periplasmic chaperone [Paraburkholderia sp. LEh10]|uniref:fimbria/pilus periplasmic chaperone n=1 Tax=Paraburkholderia sp. LEh10 TaxID=2821353 RepID=UPI001AE78554|nr:fimbria/pilus periplasmic chaperone [Paraburkholderia sp. LEh10]MBP0591322.1 fimbria/pilus periplasmic chaperone [Paraburkholderia sp. LEh10]
MSIRRTVSSALAASVLALGAMLPFAADASVVIAGTRVVYNAADSEVTLKLSNVGKSPALTQIWLDKGDLKADPSKLDLPFMLTPPLARIDPGKSQTIRIAYTGEAMPQDRETLLWFNVLEVPPKPTAEQAGANHVQLAFRTRLKFFFRPAGLAGKSDEAPDHLTWRMAAQNGRPALLVSNPTPYHVTVIEAHVGEGEQAPRFDDGGMVDPGGQLELPLSGSPAAGGKVSFTTLNDYGGPMKHEAALQ